MPRLRADPDQRPKSRPWLREIVTKIQNANDNHDTDRNLYKCTSCFSCFFEFVLDSNPAHIMEKDKSFSMPGTRQTALAVPIERSPLASPPNPPFALKQLKKLDRRMTSRKALIRGQQDHGQSSRFQDETIMYLLDMNNHEIHKRR